MTKEFKPLEPTPTGYARLLITLIRDTSNLEDKDWASQELMSLFIAMERKIRMLEAANEP